MPCPAKKVPVLLLAAAAGCATGHDLPSLPRRADSSAVSPAGSAASSAPRGDGNSPRANLLELSIEELLDVRVTNASRLETRPEATASSARLAPPRPGSRSLDRPTSSPVEDRRPGDVRPDGRASDSP